MPISLSERYANAQVIIGNIWGQFGHGLRSLMGSISIINQVRSCKTVSLLAHYNPYKEIQGAEMMVFQEIVDSVRALLVEEQDNLIELIYK
jgi:hypothetical protein